MSELLSLPGSADVSIGRERDQSKGLHNVRDCLSLAVKLKYGAIVHELIE